MLPGRLRISLTSYAPRFDCLHKTLRSLLCQTIEPDELTLWIAHGDRHLLPHDVLLLADFGVTIRFCEDIRSYKKIIPALLEDQDCFIITADDDVCYPTNWLANFVESYHADNKTVLCQRAHRIRLSPRGNPLPYAEWIHDVAADQPSCLTFATGIGGVFYPPNVFHREVCNESIFMNLCPTADDVWLYWMARLQGARIQRIKGPRRFTTWKGSQDDALWIENVKGRANDRQIDKLVERFGFPIA